MKTCVKCGEEKDLELFAKGRLYKDGRRGTCKKCHTEYVKNYYKSNPDKNAEKIRMNSSRDYNWKRHGLSKEEFESMVAKFDGKCHACKSAEAKNIDHDHDCCSSNRSCGKCVRGILCHNCNTALGLVKDSKDTLQKLINYL